MRSTLKIEDDLFSGIRCHCRVGLTALTQALHWEEKFLAGRRLNCCELPDTVGVDARCILRRARETQYMPTKVTLQNDDDIRAADGASHFTPGPAGIRCRGETKKEVGTM
ncbi:hypothetical protein ALC60_01812 [Trachymyrmex zeteki]|uniref:Uncharacterized protein n=1 Tax=Mycetomoellerius zeteki TaxID=64791 RepID=A0A151XFS9_9HYME|nr:hypothetical protein ALC60_01812 [Trachymyrmex zeteki]